MHIVEGTFRPDRHGERLDVVAETTGKARCPKWLPAKAREFWSKIGPELERVRLLTDFDEAAFTGLCLIVAEIRWAFAQRKRWTTTREGQQKLHPVLDYRLKLLEKLHVYCSDFGMTPAARARVEAIALGGSRSSNPEPPKATGTDGKAKLTTRRGRPI